MFVLLIGNTGGSFVSSWKRGIPRKNPCTCNKNRPVVTGLLTVIFTPSFDNYFILSNCFTRSSCSCRKRNVCEMAFAYHGHLFTVKTKSFPIYKLCSYLARGFYGEFQYRQLKSVTLLKTRRRKVGAKFRTIYLKL